MFPLLPRPQSPPQLLLLPPPPPPPPPLTSKLSMPRLSPQFPPPVPQPPDDDHRQQSGFNHSMTFGYHIGLFGHMRIHGSGIHRNVGTPNTYRTSENFLNSGTTSSLTTFNIMVTITISEDTAYPVNVANDSARAVTCKSIALRLVSQCQGY
ncbi:hypothetical protein SprV_0100252200 [Sparganum proliferum]